MDPSIAKIQSSQRYSPCFFLFLTSYPFVKFQSLLNDYVNKATQKYSKLEELNYYKSHYLLQRTSDDILFPAPVFNSE